MRVSAGSEAIGPSLAISETGYRPVSMLDQLIVKPGAAANLAGRDPRDTLGLTGKPEGNDRLKALLVELSEYQIRLWAEDRRSVLLILQGLDASGKDGAIRKVFTGVNPQGCRVVSFRAPTATELAHDFLWRIHANCPARGEIGIFNRSHYEDYVTVGVMELAPDEVWRPRLAHIREFERMLTDEGTTIVKCYLQISKEEQKQRLEARLAKPKKRWKFNLRDLEARRRWDRFIAAYEEALSTTSTEFAPWYVVPADRKWVRNVVVAELLVETLRSLDPHFPQVQVDAVTIE
jgi:PPK2 family polyphosphate:nucleotide phosphotransferase